MKFLCAFLFSLCIISSVGRSVRSPGEERSGTNWGLLLGNVLEKIPEGVKEKIKELPIDKVTDTLANFSDKFEIKEKINNLKETFSSLTADDIGFKGLKKLAKEIPDDLSVSDGLKAIVAYVPKEVREDETLNKYYEKIKGQVFDLGSAFGAWFSKKE